MTTEAAISALPNLRGYWLSLARIIWVLIALLCISLFVLGTVAQYKLLRTPCNELPPAAQPNCLPTENALHQLGLTPDDLANIYTPIATISALPLILIGCLVFWRKSGNSIGLLFSLTGVIIGSAGTNPHLLGNLLSAHPDLLIPVSFLNFLGNTAPATVYCLFPDGRFVPRWTRWLLILWTGIILYDSISNLLVPSFGDSVWSEFRVRPIMIIVMAAGIYAIIFRYRHAAGSLQREQIKWVIVATVVVATLLIGFHILAQFRRPGFYDVFLLIAYEPFYYLFGVLFAAVCIGISISRYQLGDINFLINRTLVYSLLTALIVGLYVIVVGVLGTTIQGHSNLLISILATGLIAVLIQPLRDRLQRSINRLMYGERDDPVSVLSRLGQRLEATVAPDAVLPALTQTIAQTLQLPYVAITRGADHKDEVAAAHGQPAGELVCLPLTYQGETIGQLVVAPRASSEALSPMDRHLLENIAHQTSMAVHAVNLTADLQHSRQRLVTAREEERRRLRRDLHDGLGPNLASQGLKLAAVKQLLEKDPSSAAPLLDQVMAQNKSTVEDVRRLVYGLRPPALDELGLVAAIRDYAAGMDNNSALQIEVTEPPQGLPPLTAAVEVAAYRIVSEALTNVIHHAQAHHCTIRFLQHQNGSSSILQIEIVDDGIGLPRDLRAGVGLRSMRERTEELGGTFIIEPLMNNGTHIRAQLPLIDTTVHAAS